MLGSGGTCQKATALKSGNAGAARLSRLGPGTAANGAMLEIGAADKRGSASDAISRINSETGKDRCEGRNVSTRKGNVNLMLRTFRRAAMSRPLSGIMVSGVSL